MAVTFTTKLEAVNAILANAGLSKVNSISGTLTSEVAEAVRMLDDISRECQGEGGGWHFNTEDNYELTPSGGEIAVPTNLLKIVFNPSYYNQYDPVIRGDAGTLKLYDKKSHSFAAYGTNVLKGTATFVFDYEDLPQMLREWIKIKAARKYNDDLMGDADDHRYDENDEAKAFISWKRADSAAAKRSWSGHMQRTTPYFHRGPTFIY